MENALLIGLSRQTTLERQLDVIANNIANVNTTGYKADQSLFEEHLNSGAHEDNFVGRDRRVSYVQDRGTYRDLTQGPVVQTNNPLDVAIDGAAFLAVIAVIPTVITTTMGVDPQLASFYGGTGLLIVISGCLDLVQKINSHLVMRNYPGLTED